MDTLEIELTAKMAVFSYLKTLVMERTNREKK